ncbi:hypothetical protein BU26DRAFT_203955 [Trematosphaeria pertusa]|uniref:Uncharacterized protein n=1 Tax=Trematosphaeria pertusa TaxID=390896 RepID=A0A6A6HRZ0_9PLEO|nr:uncharacterized protein BU26DRAFT_203955 [Trematosphaeria pertusa]KAF2240649.1 hypothetical protein BU26DRAFT_203955 [Trematosphaeria pertusa]
MAPRPCRWSRPKKHPRRRRARIQDYTRAIAVVAGARQAVSASCEVAVRILGLGPWPSSADRAHLRTLLHGTWLQPAGSVHPSSVRSFARASPPTRANSKRGRDHAAMLDGEDPKIFSAAIVEQARYSAVQGPVHYDHVR